MSVVLAAICLLLRLVAVSSVGLGDDEAYYWLWAQQPALAYFDHPGGVAWAIGVSTALLGDTPLAVRLPSVICEIGLALLVATQVEEHQRTVATALGLFVPVFGLTGVFAAPDASFLLAWFATAAAARRLETAPSIGKWILLGGALGATFLFKITGVLLGIGLLGWSLSAAHRRLWWKSAGPWVALGCMALVAAPTLVWNVVHDWPTVRFHAVGRHTHSVSVGVGMATWLGVHLVLWTPPVVWGVVRGLRAPKAGIWLWLALPCWVVFSVAAVLTPTKVHWWAPAWITLLPVAVLGLSAYPRLTAGWSVVLGGAHAAFLWMAASPSAALAPWSAELRGWTMLSESLLHEHPDAVAWVTPRYQTSAQLAWGARAQSPPPVLRVTGRPDQFTMWGLDQLPKSGPVLLVCASHLPCAPEEIPGLSCPSPKTTKPVLHGEGRAVRSFSIWRCVPAG